MDDIDHPKAVATVILLVLSCAVGLTAITAATAGPRSRLWSSGSVKPRRTRTSFVLWLGLNLRAALRQPADPVRDRAAGTGVVVVLGLCFVNIGLAVIVAVGLWTRSILQRRRATRRKSERLGRSLADVIDLVAVALVSGGTVADAVREVGRWSDDPFASAFAECGRQAESGRSLSDVLEELPTKLGPHIRPLVAALVATERYGSPITANLAQLAIDTRAARRREAEAAARRLPVLLLFPLVVCVLPAFLLVTVVPVIFETVSNFDFVASP